MAHSRLSLAAAQTKISFAAHKAVIQRFQEYRLLLKIGEDGGNLSMLDPQTALTLARLARETLASEYELALARRGFCEGTATCPIGHNGVLCWHHLPFV